MQCDWSAVLTTSTAWMLLRYSWPMRVEHALGAGALDPHGDAGILRLERLAELLGELQVHRGVEGDLALLLRRLDQRRRDRLGGGGARRRRTRCGERGEPLRTSRRECMSLVASPFPRAARRAERRLGLSHLASSFARDLSLHGMT